ncbi:MAG: hypothetical protein AAF702_24755 [Chloroflexota bacterium]
MLNTVLDVLEDFDFDRAAETVDMVWDDREKILGSVNLVWDNRNDIIDVVQYVMAHRGMIASLLDKLPGLLAKAGDTIEAAGDSAVRASVFLTGQDGEEGLSVRDLTELAAKALDRCQGELADVAQFIDNLGDQIDEVTIPTIEPTYTEVMGFDVISGIEWGESTLVENASQQLQKGSRRLAEMGKEFQEVAEHMRALGGTVTKAGGDLNHVGNQLSQSGDLLRGITGFGLGSVDTSEATASLVQTYTQFQPSRSPKTVSNKNRGKTPKGPSAKRKTRVANRKPRKKGSRLSQLKSTQSTTMN